VRPSPTGAGTVWPLSQTSPPTLRIPLVDLQPELDALGDELVTVVSAVLRSGRYILGPNVQAFEEEAAAYIGCAHAVGVNSGTDALAIALRALGLGSGDEVITTPFSFVATAEAIVMAGARPIFADIDAVTLNIDPASVEARLSPRTRAIIPVHLFGTPAPVEELMALAQPRGIAVIEDAAQAFGAEVGGRKVGGFGQAGAFSFFPSKPLGGCGDGGMVTTNDADVAAAVRRLRAHGAARKHHSEVVGCNSRLDELQAAVLRLKLHHVDESARRRRALAARYNGRLEGTPGIVVPRPAPGAVFHLYTVRVLNGRRDGVAAALQAGGIASAVHYPVPIHRLGPYGDRGATLPEAERASTEVLSLPLWAAMPPQVVDEVASVVLKALGRSAGLPGGRR